MAAKVLCRGRRRRRHARGRRRCGTPPRTRRCRRGRTTRRAAARPRRRKPFGEFDGCIGGWDIDGEPYTQAPGIAVRLVPRRACSAAAPTTGAASRCASGPDDFKRRSLDGLGDDWPIAYDDIKPYYDKLDRLVGIFGSMEGHPERARRHLPAAAEAALLRAADQAGGRQAEHHLHPVAAVDPHAAAQRPAGVPLLRPVRPRLRDARELLVAVGAAAAGAGDRQAAASSPTRWRAR